MENGKLGPQLRAGLFSFSPAPQRLLESSPLECCHTHTHTPHPSLCVTPHRRHFFIDFERVEGRRERGRDTLIGASTHPLTRAGMDPAAQLQAFHQDKSRCLLVHKLVLQPLSSTARAPALSPEEMQAPDLSRDFTPTSHQATSFLSPACWPWHCPGPQSPSSQPLRTQCLPHQLSQRPDTPGTCFSPVASSLCCLLPPEPPNCGHQA